MTLVEDTATLVRTASALFRSGDVREAIQAYERLLAREPGLANSWYNLALLQCRARDYAGAVISCRRALALGISEPEEVHLQLGVIFSDGFGQSDAARAELGAALSLNPDYLPAWLNLGNLQEDRGDFEEAERAYARASAIDPHSNLALARLAGLKTQVSADDPIITALREALGRAGMPPIERADLGFALGRLLDLAADYDGAFAAYAAANRVSRGIARAAGHLYDPAAQERLIDRIIATFGSVGDARAADEREPPLFICGMFRSGSTLVEQILASHSGFVSGGELSSFPALVRSFCPSFPEDAVSLSPDALRGLVEAYCTETADRGREGAVLIDKQLTNMLHVGLIKRAFPSAKIIVTTRDFVDNCLSVFFLHADPEIAYAADLDAVAHQYRQYRRLASYWKSLYPDDVHELDYDRLVADPQAETRALATFCDVPWEENMLAFHRREGNVRTASYRQVRQPLYRHASGRARHYRRHLAGLDPHMTHLEHQPASQPPRD